nr:hypothetical protein [uncultured Enterobacter sp.]DAI86990.1 MAG TPA: hypothetical protein [Caudoviricetes sp.]
MQEFRGTPGPWSGKDVGICKQDDARLQLGFIMTSDENRRDECAANAHLIAAAPELLEALQLSVSVIKNMADPSQSKTFSIELATAAIAKALGK